MSSELIFITGATGFIGSATALGALKEGYRLRIAVRKDSQIQKLSAIFSEYIDKIEFVIVPDITSEGAFSKVLDGVTYILHLASPLARSKDKNEIFKPAVEGTVGILRDAAAAKGIKKVVITSSIAALIPIDGVPEGGIVSENTDWDLSVDVDADFDTGNDGATVMRIYRASKLLANKASWGFMEKEKPGFALVTIHPSLVYGHSLLQQSAQDLEGSTNELLFSSIMQGAGYDGVLLSVYVGDVVDAHIKALNPKIKSGSRYLVSGQGYTWKDVAEIVQRKFPGVPTKVAPTEPKLQQVDTSRAENELGIRWAAPETFITEVLTQQLPYLT